MFWRRRRSATDLAEEIRSHLALEEDQLRAEGMSSEEAHRVARVEFGSVPMVEESFYRRGRWNWLDRLMRDVKFASRALCKSPGFAVTAVVTLALGVGANTAMFSVMHTVLLSMLPVHDPQSIAYAETSGKPQRSSSIGNASATFSYPVYQALQQQKTVLSDVIAYIPINRSKVGVRVGADPEEARGEMVSGIFFSGLGVPMALGRGFSAQDETNHNSVAVLSYGFWTRSFNRDPGVLGKTIFVKGLPMTVVGVSREGFEGVNQSYATDFWLPLQNRPELDAWGAPADDGKTYVDSPNWWCIPMLVRLAPGVTRDAAAAALQTVYHQAAYADLGGPQAGEKPPVLSFSEAKQFPGIEDGLKLGIQVLMAMVGLVLLIALTNIVMLLMARNATRQREFSLRLALGARRSEILWQLLTESALLVAIGGALAWFFAVGATKVLANWAEMDRSLTPDRTVLFFTLAISTISALLFGLAPLRVAIAGGVDLALKTSTATSSTDAGKTRIGRAAVAMQMALCVVLLVSAGLMVHTMFNLKNISLGIRTEGLLTFGIRPQAAHSMTENIQFYEGLLRRLRTLPGVESASVMSNRIGSGWSNNNNVTIDGKKPEDSLGVSGVARNNYIGAEFFRVLGVPIVMGREFTDADTASSQKVAVVSEFFAKRFFPNNENALGHHVSGNYKGEDFVIVGVVKDHKYTGVKEKPTPMLWYDYAQAKESHQMHVEMRVHGDAESILPEVRHVVSRMDPNLPLIEPMLQQKQFENSLSSEFLFARLAEFFGVLAIILVATGLYGTLSYRVNRRTAEIGVRMAVGARRGQVVWMILRDSLVLTAIGIVAGVPLSILAGRQMTATLYGVKPLDVVSYIVALVGVLVVGLAASAIPASKAANVNPLEALRAE